MRPERLKLQPLGQLRKNRRLSDHLTQWDTSRETVDIRFFRNLDFSNSFGPVFFIFQ